MSSFKLHKIINLNIINYLLISIFFLYSVYIVKHHYDGHHIGLIYSNAIDLINGKIPYKEIFIQYGFLTTLIHSFILLLFDNKLFFISVSSILFYSISILLISLSVKKLINSNYALMASAIILLNHPIAFLPWSNYIAFFFISLSIFLISQKKINYFLIGFFLSLSILSRQEIIIPIFLSFLILGLFNINKLKKLLFSNFIKLFLGFITPLIFFFIYLFYFKIFFYWKNYLSIPGFYLEFYEKSFFDLILNFVIFFSTESFFNFIITPQYLLISLILFFNSLLLLMIILKKKEFQNNILYISILSILLSSASLQIEIFRLYTSVIIGLIPLLFYLNKTTDHKLRNNFKKLLIYPSIFAFVFFPFGNNSTFNKNYLKNSKINLINKNYSFYNWPENKVNTINFITEITNNCKVKYLDNFTFDSLYSTISNFDRIGILPYASSSLKHSKFHHYINSFKNPDNTFVNKINSEIENENIILLMKKNYIYKIDKIYSSTNYKVIKINESNILGKPDYLNIFVPKKCLKN